MSNAPTEDGRTDAQSRFAGSPVTRREFGRLAAITGGAIALPGSATAAISSEKLTEFYEYVVTHTPDDYAVSTLVRLADESGFEDLAAAGIDARTTTDPEPAAYAELTAVETETVADLESVTRLQFTSGANPFWRLDDYPGGVIFPDATESVGNIGYEEMVAGMKHLEERHADRMRVSSIGQSPGFYNHYLEATHGENVWVAEVTNDVGDEDRFREKTKAVATLSIHGNERAGVEAGARFIEELLEGEHPDAEAVLDDVVLVFLFANPDGWLLGEPQYTRSADDSIAEYLGNRARGNAGAWDTNRQYPSLGMIDPGNYPSEPNGANLVDDEPGIDDDVPPAIAENMPDGLAIVEHLRGYENLEYSVDLHNMGWIETYCYGFVINGEYDLEHLHETFELNRRLKPRFDDEIATLLDERRDQLLDYLGEDEDSDVATVPFEYGTLRDTLGYTTTGSLHGWMSQSSEMGGLDVKTIAYELPSIDADETELLDINVRAYNIVLQELAKHAVRDVDVEVETNGTRTAYVTTDALTRSSEALSFGSAEAEKTREVLTVDRGRETMTTEIVSGTNSASFTVNPEVDTVKAELRDPDGATVATFHQLRDRGERAEWFVTEPSPGEWTVEVRNLKGTDRNTVVVEVDTILSEGTGVETPDPRDVLGYEQRNYESNPLSFFDELADIVGESNGGHGRSRGGSGAIDPLDVAEIADGGLFRGDSHNRAYDNLVIVHADGIDDADYLDAVDQFVDAGGDVVLTDTGVDLLAAMDNDLVSGFPAEAISEEEMYVASLMDKNLEHPLLKGTRDIQIELWKPTPLGYPGDFSGASPVTGIDPDAFEAAGGDIAGYGPADSDGEPLVAGGSISGTGTDGAIHVIGGMFPPANQSHLHPFGMEDYTASFFAQTMLTNALGYQQRRYADGEEILTMGS